MGITANCVRNMSMWKETIFQAAPSGDSVFQIEAAGISVCDETYHVRRAQSGMYLFEYVYRGQGTVHVNGFTCHPAAGDVYILPYGSSHEYYTIGTEQWHKVWFSANGPLIGQLLHSYRLEGIYHVPGCNQRALLFQMFSLVKSMSTG